MKWLSTTEAASLYGVNPRTLRKWASTGRVHRKNGLYLFYTQRPKVVKKGGDKKPVEAKKPKKAPVSTDVEKWLLVPDCHVPFHDKKAFSLMVRAAQAAGVTNVAVLGDFADFWAVSFHPKSPERRNDLQWEVDEVNVVLDMLDYTFTGKKKFVAGNHEHRLERYLAEKAPALFNTFRVDKLFRLKERGWQYTAYKEHTKIGNLHLTHDAGKTGKLAHVDALNVFQSCVAIGHTHRFGMAVEGNVHGVPQIGVMLGWLGDPDKCDYMHRVKAARDWAHGFGVAYIEPDGTAHLVPIPIIDGRVCIEGKVVK